MAAPSLLRGDSWVRGLRGSDKRGGGGGGIINCSVHVVTVIRTCCMTEFAHWSHLSIS